MMDSHRNCESRSDRVRLRFDLLVHLLALVTQGLAGWKSYSVQVAAWVIDRQFNTRAQVTVGYSSTCPCSAALSRQLVEQGFMDTFGGQVSLSPADVAAWLQRHATLATPHSQRSETRVVVHLDEHAITLGLLALIEHIELAVGTPVQAAACR